MSEQTEIARSVRCSAWLGRTLELTLKRQWFDMIASGEKREEYRVPSKWILSRLEGKEYDTVRFRNGYNPDSPVCVCEYKGWGYGYGYRQWGGGGSAETLVVIKLGRVIHGPNENKINDHLPRKETSL